MLNTSPKPLLAIAAISTCLLLTQTSYADTLVYGFDDGTLGDWQLIGADGEALPEESVTWVVSNEEREFAWPYTGHFLLPASSGEYRVVPTPWKQRECLLGVICHTHILRSPEFSLDGSGDLSIDMMGGCGNSKSECASNFDNPAGSPDGLPTLQQYTTTDAMGYALLDVETNQYVLHAFQSSFNDGRGPKGWQGIDQDNPFYRQGQDIWETVSISQADLAPFVSSEKTYRIDIYDSYRGPWSWMGFDTVKIPGSLVDNGGGGGVPGDVNSDGIVNAVDMDELSHAVLTGDSDARFDVNSDGTVNGADRSHWINSINNSYFGDANLDGVFDSSDLVTAFVSGKYETGDAAGWIDGDWDGDLLFTTGDLVTAFQTGKYEQGPRGAAPAIPEPSSLVMLLIGVVAFLRRR